MTSPESSKAIIPAATAYWMKRSIFLTSFFSIRSAGSKSGTSPAILTGKAEASKRVISRMPERPSIAPAHDLSRPVPNGLTMPNPVIATLLISPSDRKPRATRNRAGRHASEL